MAILCETFVLLFLREDEDDSRISYLHSVPLIAVILQANLKNKLKAQSHV